MTARQALWVGAKLLGIWLLVDALRSLAAAFPFPLGPEEQTLLHHFTAHPIQAIVQGGLGLLLFWRSAALAGRIAEGDFFGAGLVLIGAATAIVTLAELVSLIFMPGGTVPWGVACEPLIGIVLGLILFFWGLSPNRRPTAL